MVPTVVYLEAGNQGHSTSPSTTTGNTGWECCPCLRRRQKFPDRQTERRQCRWVLRYCWRWAPGYSLAPAVPASAVGRHDTVRLLTCPGPRPCAAASVTQCCPRRAMNESRMGPTLPGEVHGQHAPCERVFFFNALVPGKAGLNRLS